MKTGDIVETPIGKGSFYGFVATDLVMVKMDDGICRYFDVRLLKFLENKSNVTHVTGSLIYSAIPRITLDKEWLAARIARGLFDLEQKADATHRSEGRDTKVVLDKMWEMPKFSALRAECVSKAYALVEGIEL